MWCHTIVGNPGDSSASEPWVGFSSGWCCRASFQTHPQFTSWLLKVAFWHSWVPAAATCSPRRLTAKVAIPLPGSLHKVRYAHLSFAWSQYHLPGTHTPRPRHKTALWITGLWVIILNCKQPENKTTCSQGLAFESDVPQAKRNSSSWSRSRGAASHGERRSCSTGHLAKMLWFQIKDLIVVPGTHNKFVVMQTWHPKYNLPHQSPYCRSVLEEVLLWTEELWWLVFWWFCCCCCFGHNEHI